MKQSQKMAIQSKVQGMLYSRRGGNTCPSAIYLRPFKLIVVSANLKKQA